MWSQRTTLIVYTSESTQTLHSDNDTATSAQRNLSQGCITVPLPMGDLDPNEIHDALCQPPSKLTIGSTASEEHIV